MDALKSKKIEEAKKHIVDAEKRYQEGTENYKS